MGVTSDTVASEVVKPRRLRADAACNRRNIVAAARAQFQEHGLAAAVDDVAKQAGVGIGTVYRHFPTKSDLVDGVFEDRLDEIAMDAARAAEIADPWTALSTFFRDMCESAAGDRGMAEVMVDAKGRCHAAERVRESVTPIVAGIVERAHAAGQLRPGVAANDLFAMMTMMKGALEADTLGSDAWRRYSGLLLDGIRGSATDAPLEGQAPTDEQIDQHFTAHQCGE